jgi:hypothetical protein
MLIIVNSNVAIYLLIIQTLFVLTMLLIISAELTLKEIT